jgi:ketosteroid isomerase-like protein
LIDPEAWLGAWNSRDDEQIVALCQPDVEVHAVTLSAEGRLYNGHEGIRKWLSEVRGRFHADTRVEKAELVDDGALIMSGTLFVSAEARGGAAEQPFALLLHLRDDKASWIGTFITPEAALEAYKLGVTGPRAG